MKQILAAFLLLAPSLLRAEFYEFTDLGTLGGTDSYAVEINDRGEIAGTSRATGNLVTRAFLYRNGAFTDLGTLGGLNSYATGINNLGQVVGSADRPMNPNHGFLYSNGVMTSIGDITPEAINDSGVIVGRDFYFTAPSGEIEQRAGQYFMGVLKNLGTLPSTYRSEAHAVNATGQIAGYCYFLGDALSYAFKYGSQMNNIGTLSGGYTEAFAINDNGDVVGRSQIAAANGNGLRVAHAIVYRNGVMTDLGAFSGFFSTAYAINNSGQIVGESNNHAALFADGTVQDLNLIVANATGYVLMSALDINEAGQIVGNARAPNGQTHAFLLTPDKAAPVLKVAGKLRRATTKPKLKITGTASDNVLVKTVESKIGKSKFKSAAGTTKWKFTARLKPGKNKIQVRAIDAGGRVSAIVKLTIIRK